MRVWINSGGENIGNIENWWCFLRRVLNPLAGQPEFEPGSSNRLVIVPQDCHLFDFKSDKLYLVIVNVSEASGSICHALNQSFCKS